MMPEAGRCSHFSGDQYQQMELFNKCLEALNEAEQYIAKIPEKKSEKYIETAASYCNKRMVYKSQSNSEIALEKIPDFYTEIMKKVPIKENHLLQYECGILQYWVLLSEP